MPVAVPSTTSICIGALSPPKRAVIVVRPGLAAVAMPVAPTEATAVSLDSYAVPASPVTTRVLASENVALSVSGSVAPTARSVARAGARSRRTVTVRATRRCIVRGGALAAVAGGDHGGAVGDGREKPSADTVATAARARLVGRAGTDAVRSSSSRRSTSRYRELARLAEPVNVTLAGATARTAASAGRGVVDHD